MRIFVAGPYGDHNTDDVIAENVKRADTVARNLMAMGHEVYVPHKMSWHWEKDVRLKRDQFLNLDMGFLHFWAEALVRLPGLSPGTDGEVREAQLLGRIISVIFLPYGSPLIESDIQPSMLRECEPIWT